MIRQAQSPRTRPKLVTDNHLDQGPADAATSDSSAARLKSFVERVERIQEEIDAGNNDKKEIYAEAKGTGFNPAVMKIIIRKRKMNQADRIEQEELVDLYERELGMTV